MPTRVLVVDDSAFARKVLGRAIERAPGLELAGTARDGADALAKVERFDPDVVSLDIEMPGMSGLATLRALRAKHAHRPAVLMCSSLTEAGSNEALEALRLGAADVIAKDAHTGADRQDAFGREFASKVGAIAPPRSRPARGSRAPGPRAETLADAEQAATRLPRPIAIRGTERFEAIVIGSSTGGPPVLETIVSGLDPTCPPVVIAQHMPELFTRGLSQRLDALAAVSVRIAEPGLPLESGTVTVGLGGHHVVVKRTQRGCVVDLTDEPANALYKPDVDELFVSASRAFGPHVAGVILTGMGDDGADGALTLRAAGGSVVAQDKATSVVWGMPRAAVERGGADAVGTPDDVLTFLRRLRGPVATTSRPNRRSA